MIRLRLTSGATMWVNPAHIVCMESAPWGTHLFLAERGVWIDVETAPETIADWARRR